MRTAIAVCSTVLSACAPAVVLSDSFVFFSKSTADAVDYAYTRALKPVGDIVFR